MPIVPSIPRTEEGRNGARPAKLGRQKKGGEEDREFDVESFRNMKTKWFRQRPPGGPCARAFWDCAPNLLASARPEVAPNSLPLRHLKRRRGCETRNNGTRFVPLGVRENTANPPSGAGTAVDGDQTPLYSEGEGGARSAWRREKRVSRRELVKETSPVAGSGLRRALVSQVTRLEERRSW